MGSLETADGTRIHYKDRGSGQPVVFSHGWPLSADAWDSQMFHLASRGFRCIAHDRRGHGRSGQPWAGNDMDTNADDLAELLDTLDLKDVVLVGHSTGGGEVARCIGRHGSRRVAKAVLVGSVTPLMLKTEANPGGLAMEVFDGFRASFLADRAQFFLDVASGPFFGFNRPGADVSRGVIQSWWRQGMQAGHKNAYDCIRAFSETDFTEDLKRFDVPTLVIHGDDDQVVPLDATARLSARLVPGATLKVYPGGSHGLADTSKEQLNADLLAFIRDCRKVAVGVADRAESGSCDSLCREPAGKRARGRPQAAPRMVAGSGRARPAADGGRRVAAGSCRAAPAGRRDDARVGELRRRRERQWQLHALEFRHWPLRGLRPGGREPRAG